MKARVPGRQAHMMATLHSMADQVAAPTLSSVGVLECSFCRGEGGYSDVHVGSEELDMTNKLFKRRILVIRTLWLEMSAYIQLWYR